MYALIYQYELNDRQKYAFLLQEQAEINLSKSNVACKESDSDFALPCSLLQTSFNFILLILKQTRLGS